MTTFQGSEFITDEWQAVWTQQVVGASSP